MDKIIYQHKECELNGIPIAWELRNGCEIWYANECLGILSPVMAMNGLYRIANCLDFIVGDRDGLAKVLIGWYLGTNYMWQQAQEESDV